MAWLSSAAKNVCGLPHHARCVGTPPSRPPEGCLRTGAQGQIGREEGGGVRDPKFCPPEMARPDFPNGRFRFFPRWSLWSGVGGGGGSRGASPSGRDCRSSLRGCSNMPWKDEASRCSPPIPWPYSAPRPSVPHPVSPALHHRPPQASRTSKTDTACRRHPPMVHGHSNSSCQGPQGLSGVQVHGGPCQRGRAAGAHLLHAEELVDITQGRHPLPSDGQALAWKSQMPVTRGSRDPAETRKGGGGVTALWR